MSDLDTTFADAAAVYARMSASDLPDRVAEAAARMAAAVSAGGTIYWVGNGGSAADAQHLAAELVGRFHYDRPPIRSHALTVNASTLTALINDLPADELYARQVRAFVGPNDVLVCISTSGRSPNILAAADAGRAAGAWVLGLCGEVGPLLERVDFALRVPSRDTARIQEGHILIGHALCEQIEHATLP